MSQAESSWPDTNSAWVFSPCSPPPLFSPTPVLPHLYPQLPFFLPISASAPPLFAPCGEGAEPPVTWFQVLVVRDHLLVLVQPVSLSSLSVSVTLSKTEGLTDTRGHFLPGNN